MSVVSSLLWLTFSLVAGYICNLFKRDYEERTVGQFRRGVSLVALLGLFVLGFNSIVGAFGLYSHIVEDPITTPQTTGVLVLGTILWIAGYYYEAHRHNTRHDRQYRRDVRWALKELRTFEARAVIVEVFVSDREGTWWQRRDLVALVIELARDDKEVQDLRLHIETELPKATNQRARHDRSDSGLIEEHLDSGAEAEERLDHHLSRIVEIGDSFEVYVI